MNFKAPIYLCFFLGLAGKRQSCLSARPDHNDQRIEEQAGVGVLDASERRRETSRGRVSVEAKQEWKSWLNMTSEDRAGGRRSRDVWNQDHGQNHTRWVGSDGDRVQLTLALRLLGSLQVPMLPVCVLDTNLVLHFAY